MLNSKQLALRPLIISKDGVHLTTYLKNTGDLSQPKTQLARSLQEAQGWLAGVMTPQERERFLDPLESLLNDARILQQMTGNIGVFRNKDTFRVLNIPVDVEESCQVATSFHVKPLLRWLQSEREFLLLGLQDDSAHLYVGGQETFRMVDSCRLPRSFAAEVPRGFLGRTVFFTWLETWIEALTKTTRPKLFLAGALPLVRSVKHRLSYSETVAPPISETFNKYRAFDYCLRTRKLLEFDSKKELASVILEFERAEEEELVKSELPEIARAVLDGKVRKLLITDEVKMFGRIDQKTGEVTLHPFDLDHEDDCVLDDLAQQVLSQGGEVFVAKIDEIPSRQPILALLDPDTEVSKRHVARFRAQPLEGDRSFAS